MEKLDELYSNDTLRQNEEEIIGKSVSDSISSNLTRTSSTFSGGGIMGNLMVVVMLLFFTAILIVVGAQIASIWHTTSGNPIQTSDTPVTTAAAMVQASNQMAGLLSLLPIAVVAFMGGIAIFFLLGYGRRLL